MKITINVTRPNGTTENIDVTGKFAGMNQEMFEHIKKSTKDAGRGDVNFCEVIETKNNLKKLAREWNNLHNEGAEGYIPMDALVKSDKYKEWEETKIYK